MSEIGRSLSEIAYDTIKLPGVELAPKVIDSALIEAGIDPKNERERIRFQRMVEANVPLHKFDALARCKFASEARERLGEEADDWQVIELARVIEAAYEFDLESYQDD